VAACLELEDKDRSPLLQALKSTLRLLAWRWRMLSEELRELDAALERLARQAAPSLVARLGVGPQTAATLLVTAGDNPERLRNDAALAALCGVSPLEASSGKITRHRLNRGGDRKANNALWTIALVRMRSDPRTRAYVERRTQEGRSTKEIQRCLKRYLVRELYPLIIADLRTAGAAPLT
jgi:transposase